MIAAGAALGESGGGNEALAAGLGIGVTALCASLAFVRERQAAEERRHLSATLESLEQGVSSLESPDSDPAPANQATVGAVNGLTGQALRLELALSPLLVSESARNGGLGARVSSFTERQERLESRLDAATTELENGSQEILLALQFQEECAHEQAGAVEETRRTMESLLDAAKHIALTAESVHTSVQRTKEHNQAIAQQAAQLDRHTQGIASALKGIRKIADRSDVIALNAALEGTKAGEAGKGFIILADEMRRLAENVVVTVREIEDHVALIKASSESTVKATAEGVELSEEAARSTETIRLTSQQQQSGTRMVSESMVEVSKLLSHSLAGAKECTSALAELSRRAEELRESPEESRGEKRK